MAAADEDGGMHSTRPAPDAAAPDAAALLAAYLRARYRVALAPGRWLELHVGRPPPEPLARWQPRAPLTLVTAWNPRSQPRTEAENARADAALRADLAAAGWPVLPAENSDREGRWREPGWLVAGPSAAQADALARRYGQAGVLHAAPGQPVRLRMYLPRPAGPAVDAVDWCSPL